MKYNEELKIFATVTHYLFEDIQYKNEKAVSTDAGYAYMFESLFKILDKYIKTESLSFRILGVTIRKNFISLKVRLNDTMKIESYQLNSSFLIKLYYTYKESISDEDKCKFYGIIRRTYINSDIDDAVKSLPVDIKMDILYLRNYECVTEMIEILTSNIPVYGTENTYHIIDDNTILKLRSNGEVVPIISLRKLCNTDICLVAYGYYRKCSAIILGCKDIIQVSKDVFLESIETDVDIKRVKRLALLSNSIDCACIKQEIRGY